LSRFVTRSITIWITLGSFFHNAVFNFIFHNTFFFWLSLRRQDFLYFGWSASFLWFVSRSNGRNLSRTDFSYSLFGWFPVHSTGFNNFSAHLFVKITVIAVRSLLIFFFFFITFPSNLLRFFIFLRFGHRHICLFFLDLRNVWATNISSKSSLRKYRLNSLFIVAIGIRHKISVFIRDTCLLFLLLSRDRLFHRGFILLRGLYPWWLFGWRFSRR
jgi:hypothetical protein